MNTIKPVILVDENIPQADEYFGQLGIVERFSGRNLSPKQLGGARALIVRSVTVVDKHLLEGSAIDFVGTCTIGTDHIDQPWLQHNNIRFASAPGCNANSVAEYVLTALAALNCHWQGLTIGIVGCGNVGGALYRKFVSLGVKVVGYDPLIEPTRFPKMASLEEVFGADVVCLHTPLTRSGPYPTYHMISQDLLNQMKRNAILINAGRGPVIDSSVLLSVMDQRPDIRLVLDVWEQEPWVDPALLARVALGTPHIAGYSWDGKVAGTRMIYQALAEYWQCPTTVEGHSLAVAATTEHFPLLSDAEWQEVQSVLLSAYDIFADDQRLRQMVHQAKDQGAIKIGFDLLRRHYPERREFRYSSSQHKSNSSAVNFYLGQLGFTFSAHHCDK